MFLVPAAYREAARAAAQQNPLTPTEKIVIECDEALRRYGASEEAMERVQAARMRVRSGQRTPTPVTPTRRVFDWDTDDELTEHLSYIGGEALGDWFVAHFVTGAGSGQPRGVAAEQEQRRAVIARHPSSAGGGDEMHGRSAPPADTLRRAAARITSLAEPARSRSARAFPQGAGENAGDR